jgi:hypothetical protein
VSPMDFMCLREFLSRMMLPCRVAIWGEGEDRRWLGVFWCMSSLPIFPSTSVATVCIIETMALLAASANSCVVILPWSRRNLRDLIVASTLMDALSSLDWNTDFVSRSFNFEDWNNVRGGARWSVGPCEGVCRGLLPGSTRCRRIGRWSVGRGHVFLRRTVQEATYRK